MKKKKKKLNPNPLLYVLIAVILVGSIQAILSKDTTEVSVISENIETAHLEAPVAPQATSSELLSNGDRVIYTKTPYFDNEVQVWLASEQACQSVNLGEQCLKDLMAMAWTESRSFNYRAMGDGNKSYGAWQIHRGYHPDVTVEQATDPYWAAKWTIKRLIAKGYLKDREFAIRSHNGNPMSTSTLPYIQTVNKYLAMN